MSKTNDMAAIPRISAERMFLQHVGNDLDFPINHYYGTCLGLDTVFRWCQLVMQSWARTSGPGKNLDSLVLLAHVEIELCRHDLFIKIQHDDKSHFNLALTCISLESYFS